MLARRKHRAEPGSWPHRSPRPRVLVENADGAVRSAYAGILDRAGYDVETCGGPGNDDESVRCPLLVGSPCPLVEGADVVLSSSSLGDSRAILTRLASETGPPVVFEAPKPMFDSYRDVAGASCLLPIPVTEASLRAAVADVRRDA